MNRVLTATAAASALLTLAACGSSTAAGPGGSSSSSSGSSTSGGRFGRNAAAGELVRINGTTLIVNTQSGDVTVDVSNSTFSKTSTGTVADIVTGSCAVITGRKDSTGALTATMVLVSQPVNGSCPAAGGGPGGLGGGGGPRRTPNPSASPRAGDANFAGARGQVTAVNGTSVTLQPTTGVAQTVIVPTTVRVTHAESASLGDLELNDCVLATGPKDASGTVAARTVTVVPAGPSGCFTGGGFGRGGGGFGGGGGGGAGGGTGGGTPPTD